MADERVYIHELVDITGHRRADYLHHVTANWSPVGREQRGQLCFGVWATVGSTGRWPQVVNLWEYASWAALGANFETELTGAGLQDPALDEWWAAASDMRSGGFDRILVAPDWSPSITTLCDEGPLGAAGYVHETITCRRGARDAFLERVRDDGIDRHASAGLRHVGTFARAMANDDEVIAVWSFAEWSAWADYERSSHRRRDDAIGGWRVGVDELVEGWERIALADAPLSPLRTGRQPQVSDRRPAGR